GPGPPKCDTSLPSASNSSTNGAAVQHFVEVGGVAIMPFSFPSSESAPRCATHTWSCASTATPVIDPKTQWLGSGCGQNGLTCRFGAPPCPLALTTNSAVAAHTQRVRFMRPPP